MVPRSPLRCAPHSVPEVPKPLWRGRAHSLVLTWGIGSVFVAVFALIVLVNAFERDHAKRITGGAWVRPIGILVIAYVISMWIAHASLEVADDAMRVRFGAGWPTRVIPWERVKSVEYVYVRPMQWGGWGYRVRPARKATALVLRAGDGLQVTFANDHVFVITVDDAKRGLDVIRKVLERK